MECLLAQVAPVLWSSSPCILCHPTLPYETDLIPKCEKCHPPPPPLVICDGVEEYEVEKVLDSQLFHRRIEYLVHWKGYGVEEDK